MDGEGSHGLNAFGRGLFRDGRTLFCAAVALQVALGRGWKRCDLRPERDLQSLAKLHFPNLQSILMTLYLALSCLLL